MTVRNLQALFQPRSVAVVGASEQPGSIGRIVTENLLRSGFTGPVFPVNPNRKQVLEVSAYPDLGSLPDTPDLAVIVTPPATVPGLVAELGERGTRAACVISAGFAETGQAEAVARQQAILDAARPYTLRVVGPNCLGFLAPGANLNASFAHLFPARGHLAFIAQSGAVVTSVLDWAEPRNIGFSLLASLGNMADVDFGDLLDYLTDDDQTHAILLYIENIKNARKFISAARAAARTKPVIVVKAGRFRASARAVSSHTGALAGSDMVYDAVFRRAGMLRVYTLEALFEAVETLALLAHRPAGDRLAILSNGGGTAVIATDALIEAGGRLAELGESTVSRLNRILPEHWPHGNPIDILGDATGERYAAALTLLLEDPEVDGILVLNCPSAVASSDEIAQAVIAAVPSHTRKTVLASWIGQRVAEQPRTRLRNHGIPVYQTPEGAVEAFMQMVNYRRNQAMLMETPPSLPEWFQPDSDAVRERIQSALANGQSWLSPLEAMRVVEAYGIRTVATHWVADPAAAAQQARQMGGRVAIKVNSVDINHKTDAGGVALNVEPANAEAVARELLLRVGESRPAARLDGLVVQPMVWLQNSRELIAGVIDDQQFGPIILFGHGGTAVEVLQDKAVGLPPLNLKLARELMAGTRVFQLLQGYRDVPAANLELLATNLVRLSRLAVDFPEIRELDINPLLANGDTVMALDARIRVGEVTGGSNRLAIRPYPKELEQDILLKDGRSLLLRPIVPEDEPALQATFARLTPEEVRFRFFVPRKLLDHITAARFSQIDYDRQMALVLTEHGIPGAAEIYGVVRLVEDPDREFAEFAIVIEQKLAGQGLGTMLLQQIIDYATQRGIREIYGDVLSDNHRMLRLCRKMGFSRARNWFESGVVRMVRPLGNTD